MTIQEKERFKVRLENCKLYMKNKGVSSPYLYYVKKYGISISEMVDMESRFRTFWRGGKSYDESLLEKYETLIYADQIKAKMIGEISTEEKDLFNIRHDNVLLYLNSLEMTNIPLFFCNFYQLDVSENSERAMKFLENNQLFFDEVTLLKFEAMINNLRYS